MEFIKVIRNKNKRVKELKRLQVAELKQSLEISAYTSSLQEYVSILDYLFLGDVKAVYITPPKEYVNYFIQSIYKLGELQKYRIEQISESKFKISELELDLV